MPKPISPGQVIVGLLQEPTIFSSFTSRHSKSHFQTRFGEILKHDEINMRNKMNTNRILLNLDTKNLPKTYWKQVHMIQRIFRKQVVSPNLKQSERTLPLMEPFVLTCLDHVLCTNMLACNINTYKNSEILWAGPAQIPARSDSKNRWD